MMRGKGVVFLIVSHTAENAAPVFRIIRVSEPVPHSPSSSRHIGFWESFNLQPALFSKLDRHQGLTGSRDPVFSATRRNHTYCLRARYEQHPREQVTHPILTLVDELEHWRWLLLEGIARDDATSLPFCYRSAVIPPPLFIGERSKAIQRSDR